MSGKRGRVATWAIVLAGLVAASLAHQHSPAQEGALTAEEMQREMGRMVQPQPEPAFVAEVDEGARPSTEEAKRRAHAPNVTVEVHQRTFMPGDKAHVRVSLYNLKSATLYAMPLRN